MRHTSSLRNHPRSPLRRDLCALPIVALAVLGGCRALPDVTPFATATTELSAALHASGKAASDDIATLANGAQLAGTFDTGWAARLAAMQALSRYADSLAAIALAAEEGGDGASALGARVGELATAAGIVDPAVGASVKVTADVARLVWGQIARARAADGMEEAMAAAQPAIAQIGATLASDTKDVRLAVRAAYAAQERQLTEDDATNAIVGLHLTSGPKAKADVLRGVDLPIPKDSLDKLDAINRSLDATRGEYDAYRAAHAALRARRAAVGQLLDATDDGLVRWAAAHESVLVALRSRRPVTVESLAAAVVEIRNLIKKVREP